MRPKLTGTVGEPVYLIYVEIEHANFQPSQVRMNRIQTILVLIELYIGMVEVLKLRRFSFFFFKYWLFKRACWPKWNL